MIRVDLDEGCGVGQGATRSPEDFDVYVNPLLTSANEFFVKYLKDQLMSDSDIKVLGSKMSAMMQMFADDAATQFPTVGMACRFYASVDVARGDGCMVWAE